ncbi:MAG: hypothetical protein IKF82_01430 [Bacilli bacterium]|nr:hypothetical protein [Bacilli bacterium]
MLLKEYDELNLKRGTIHSIHWKRTLKKGDALKGFEGRITKETVGNFRIGVEYANMKVNEGKVVGSLPYGFYELRNEIIYSPSSDTHQLRLTNTMGSNKPKVKWYLDGNEITKDELIAMNALGASQRKVGGEPPLVINVKLDDIIEIK